MIGLSALLTASTIMPRMPITPAATGLAAGIAALAAAAVLAALRTQPAPGLSDRANRRTWTMPPIESLKPPACLAWRTLGLIVLRCYLLASITVLAVRAVQIALRSG